MDLESALLPPLKPAKSSGADDVIFGVIDKGGNSSKIEWRFADDPFKTSCELPKKMHAYPKMAEGIAETGSITKKSKAIAMAFLGEAIEQIEQVRRDHPKSPLLIRTIGTAPFRDADNGEKFAKKIRKDTGLPLVVLQSEQEAYYAARGVLARCKNPGEVSGLVVEQGGGSTDYIPIFRGEIITALAQGMPTGTLSANGADDPMEYIRSYVADMPKELAALDNIFYIGGTPRTMIRSFSDARGISLKGRFTDQAADIEEVLEYMQGLSYGVDIMQDMDSAQLAALLNVKAERLDLLHPSALHLRALQERFDMRSITLTKATARDGHRAEMSEQLEAGFAKPKLAYRGDVPQFTVWDQLRLAA